MKKYVLAGFIPLLCIALISVRCQKNTEPAPQTPSEPGSVVLPDTPAEYFTYTTNNGEIIITGYTGAFTGVGIPKTINGLPVTTIACNAFLTNKTLTAIYASSVLVIEGISFSNSAFFVCENLTNANFPEATTIGESAFEGCIRLKDASFPKATTIGNTAFYNCENLKNANFPLVTTIGNSAFECCSSLTNAHFPLAAEIDAWAFYDCLNLSNANFPLATTIDNYAFYYCVRLTNANFPLATSIGKYAFYYCSNLANAAFGALTNISENAFSSCAALQAVTINNSASPGTVAANAFSSTPDNKTLYVPTGAQSAYTTWDAYGFSSIAAF